MRALVLQDGTPRLDARRAEPVAAAGEVLLRPHLAAIGRSERCVAAGRFGFSGVLGGEGVGSVEAVGADVDRAWIGRRVVVHPASWCGDCPRCRSGLRDHCLHRTFLGRLGRDGWIAERIAVPAAGLVAVPDSLDDEAALFAGAVAAAIQSRRHVPVAGRPYVTVLGDGPVGIVMGLVLAPLNASVRLVGRHPGKLAACERWGLRHRPLAEIGRRADQDVVIDCTGADDGLATALTLVRPRGTIVAASTAPERPRLDDAALVADEVRLVGSSGGPLPEAIAMLARGELDPRPLLSRRLRLDDALAALGQSARPEFLRLAVTP